MFKNNLISILIMSVLVLLIPLILSLLSLVLDSKIISILKIVLSIFTLLTGGYLIGKKSKKKGYFEGIKLGIIFLILTSIFNYSVLNSTFNIKNLVYYLILIISCMFGSMIGINKNKAT